MPSKSKSSKSLFSSFSRREVPPMPHPQSSSDSDFITINCWMLGDRHDQIFKVMISRNKDVYALKCAIKAENQSTLKNIDTKALALYGVSIPATSQLADDVDTALRLNQVNLTLGSLTTLSQVFANGLPNGLLHVVVGILSSPQGGPILRDAVETPHEGGGEPSGSGCPVKGYELISDVIMDGKGVFEPLWKLPPHIRRMRRHDDTSGTQFILKECRPGSDEAKILKFLQTLKPPCNHIISLIETIETNAATWIVVPERQSVKEQLHCFTHGGNLRGMFLDLSRDLTIGLSFLHKNGIAHLDIKPSNLVYTNTNESRGRLEIIDFDVAVQVQNEDEEIDDYCGSRDWMAPEIGEENGPRRMYSPMRADKWSCGRVLRLFAERHGEADEGLRGFATRLMDGNPRNRPPLLEWHEGRREVTIAVVPKKRRRVDVDMPIGMSDGNDGNGVQLTDSVMMVKAH